MALLMLSAGASPAQPVSLQWNTFVGGVDVDYGRAIVRDAGGNVYVAGTATATFGDPIRPFHPTDDGFVAKIAPNGARLWVTFMGSTASGLSIALDSAGNVYVAGQSTATWGTPLNPYSAGSDGFVAKFGSDGTLLWSSFFGSLNNDLTNSIRVAGNTIFIAGSSSATWGAPVRPYSSNSDAFVLALNADSGAQLWHTFLGGTGNDNGWGVAADANGKLFVAGQTNGASWGSPVRPYNANYDGFVARLDQNTGALDWNTFLGGVWIDYVAAIEVDANGDVYTGGQSYEPWGSPIVPFSQGPDAVVAKLSGATGALAWHTFLGGSGNDAIYYGVALDTRGGVYVAGESSAVWGTPFNGHAGNRDAFVARLDANGVRSWNTFFGAQGSEGAYGLTADALGTLSVVGSSDKYWSTPTSEYGGGTSDGFICQLKVDVIFLDGFQQP